MEPIGVCLGCGKTVCGMAAGGDTVKVAREGKTWYGLVNGRVVLAGRDPARLAPVILDMVSALCRRAKTDKFRYAHDGKAAQIQEIDRYIRQNKDQYDLFLLEQEGKPDELAGNKPKEASLPGSLAGLREHIAESSRNMADVRHLAGILLKTEPARDMWGGKEVGAVLSGIRQSMAKLADETEPTERRLEHMDGAARYMQECFGNPRVADRVRAAAGKVVEDFAAVKGYMSELAQTLRRLYDIDKVFKAHTGYPATWFLTTSILTDFMFEYGALVNNLVGAAAAEAQAVEPMLVWKIQTMGV